MCSPSSSSRVGCPCHSDAKNVWKEVPAERYPKLRIFDEALMTPEQKSDFNNFGTVAADVVPFSFTGTSGSYNTFLDCYDKVIKGEVQKLEASSDSNMK